MTDPIMDDFFHLILAHDPATMGHEWQADPEDNSPRGCKVCNDNVRGEFDE